MDPETKIAAIVASAASQSQSQLTSRPASHSRTHFAVQNKHFIMQSNNNNNNKRKAHTRMYGGREGVWAEKEEERRRNVRAPNLTLSLPLTPIWLACLARQRK